MASVCCNTGMTRRCRASGAVCNTRRFILRGEVIFSPAPQLPSSPASLHFQQLGSVLNIPPRLVKFQLFGLRRAQPQVKMVLNKAVTSDVCGYAYFKS